jgi:hypothetical protein
MNNSSSYYKYITFLLLLFHFLTVFSEKYMIESSTSALLRDESELTNNCYSFPDQDFGKSNNIKSVYGSSPHIILKQGQ